MSAEQVKGGEANKLDSTDFQKAWDGYIHRELYEDHHKLIKRQLEKIKISWIPLDDDSAQDGEDVKNHILSGELHLSNDYICIPIHVKSTWIHSESSHLESSIFEFQLTSKAEWSTQEQHVSIDSKSHKHLDRKVRKRLLADDYIKQLFNRKDSEFGMRACHAVIEETYDQRKSLVERMDVSEDALEGIRRALMSQMDSNLMLLELLLSLPWLDCSNESSSPDRKRRAQSRAKLRLLEDAMVDECEKVGEEELLDNLTLREHADGSEIHKSTQLDNQVHQSKKKLKT